MGFKITEGIKGAWVPDVYGMRATKVQRRFDVGRTTSDRTSRSTQVAESQKAGLDCGVPTLIALKKKRSQLTGESRGSHLARAIGQRIWHTCRQPKFNHKVYLGNRLSPIVYIITTGGRWTLCIKLCFGTCTWYQEIG
jgi:hypothetical protein